LSADFVVILLWLSAYEYSSFLFSFNLLFKLLVFGVVTSKTSLLSICGTVWPFEHWWSSVNTNLLRRFSLFRITLVFFIVIALFPNFFSIKSNESAMARPVFSCASSFFSFLVSFLLLDNEDDVDILLSRPFAPVSFTARLVSKFNGLYKCSFSLLFMFMWS